MQKPTLLVVDSYDSSRRALTDLLHEWGYSVLAARNGVEGFRIAHEKGPELVIADLWPFFSASVQMVERLRQQDATKHIPVLLLTSSVCWEYRERALSAGCDGYLEKPCAPEELHAEVRRLLSPYAFTRGLPLRVSASAHPQ